MVKLSNNFFKNKRIKSLKRKVGNRGKPKDTFLIICEGEKTEPNYFLGFRLLTSYVIDLDIKGIGANTESLVKEAIKIKNEAKNYGYTYDQVWCVFDKDDFSDKSFNYAIKLAEKNKIKVAYSNESFELWYLLHFCYVDIPLHRNDYIKKLSKFLTEKYRKNDNLMYNKLIKKQPDAIRNAKKLLSTYINDNPSKNNPSTTVHNLVESLNKFIKQQ